MQFNIADLFEAVADHVPRRPAVVCGDVRHSFAELDARANRLASFLRRRGVGHGDHIGLHLYNSAEFVEAMLAALKLRAVPINLNYRYVAAELRYLIDNADLVCAITEAELAGVLGEAAAGIDAVTTAIVRGGGDDARAGDLEAFDYEAALAEGSPERDFGPRSGDDLYIIYTGGTTGMPKGVMWRQEDMFFAGLQGGNPGGEPIARPEEILGVVGDDPDEGGVTMMPAAPFIHGAAQWAAWIGLFTGGKLVLQPGRSFEAPTVCGLIERERANTITLVGDAMARPLGEELARGDYDVSSLYVIASAGAVLSPAVRELLGEQAPDCMVLNNFGATETGHQGSAFPGEDTGADGRPSFAMDGSSVVFDDDWKPLAPGSGKIGKLARSGRIPLGYYKDEAKTADRFRIIDGARWCVPGDFATVEADGRITVYGRGSNCINSGGEKVFPEEVEEALKAHPDVFDALVIGVDDERWMQRVAAVVEPRAGKAPTLEELQAHCRAVIAGYKVPRQLALVDRVARQPSGKPDYAWARERIAQEER